MAAQLRLIRVVAPRGRPTDETPHRRPPQAPAVRARRRQHVRRGASDGLEGATVKKLFYELIDANMIEAGARDEPMQLTQLGRAVLKGGVGTFKIKKDK